MPVTSVAVTQYFVSACRWHCAHQDGHVDCTVLWLTCCCAALSMLICCCAALSMWLCSGNSDTKRPTRRANADTLGPPKAENEDTNFLRTVGKNADTASDPRRPAFPCEAFVEPGKATANTCWVRFWAGVEQNLIAGSRRIVTTLCALTAEDFLTSERP